MYNTTTFLCFRFYLNISHNSPYNWKVGGGGEVSQSHVFAHLIWKTQYIKLKQVKKKKKKESTGPFPWPP